MMCTGLSATFGWSFLGPFEYCMMRKNGDGKTLGEYHPTWRGGGVINGHALLVGYRCETRVSPSLAPAVCDKAAECSVDADGTSSVERAAPADGTVCAAACASASCRSTK